MTTTQEAFNQFIQSLIAHGRSPQTLHSYTVRLSSFLSQHGPTPLTQLTPQHLEAWLAPQHKQNQRWQNHPYHPHAAGSLSPVTLRGRVMALKTFLHWTVRRGYLSNSPALEIPLPRINRLLHNKAMTKENLFRLLDTAAQRAEEGQSRDLALLCFFADTGCRVGEAATLILSNLDFTKHQALINGKTGLGIVTFTPATTNALQQWLTQRPNTIPSHNYVFTSILRASFGQPMTVNAIYLTLRRLAHDAHIDPGQRFNPHAIRHLVGQEWADHVNLALVQSKLRHADISTTSIYANQDIQRIHQATSQLSLIHAYQNQQQPIQEIDMSHATDLLVQTDNPIDLESFLLNHQTVLLPTNHPNGHKIARTFASPGFIKLAIETYRLGKVIGQLTQPAKLECP